jgi:hypothetical protein
MGRFREVLLRLAQIPVPNRDHPRTYSSIAPSAESTVPAAIR